MIRSPNPRPDDPQADAAKNDVWRMWSTEGHPPPYYSTVKLVKNSEQYNSLRGIFLRVARAHGDAIIWHENVWYEYDDDDLRAADAVRMVVELNSAVLAGPVAKNFAIDVCSGGCGLITTAVQLRDLVLKRRPGKRHVIFTEDYSALIVSTTVQRLFVEAGCEHIDFRPLYPRENADTPITSHVQLATASWRRAQPPRFVYATDTCETCGRWVRWAGDDKLLEQPDDLTKIFIDGSSGPWGELRVPSCKEPNWDVSFVLRADGGPLWFRRAGKSRPQFSQPAVLLSQRAYRALSGLKSEDFYFIPAHFTE